MNTKFIGIDGYGKIENLNSKKKSSALKNIRKFFRICSIIIAEEVFKPHNEIKTVSKYTSEISKKFLKKKAVFTAFVAVILCVITATSPVFAAEEYTTVEKDAKISTSFSESQMSDDELTKDAQTSISKSLSNNAVLSYGYGLYIDKELVGVALEKDQLENALQKFLDDYKAKYDDETTDEFANSVEVIEGSYDSALVDKSENIVENNKDKFSVSLSTDIIMTQTVPYVTKEKYDGSKYEDYEKVVQQGVEGKQKITYRVTYIDGEFADSYATKTKTVKEAQDKIVVVGTKEKYASTGTFAWPVPYTRNITSYYGPRWGSYHYGIDIAASGVNGQAIVASDGGTVTWAGWDSSGYGYYVIIDHGNGYSTLYGHCSNVYVTKGQFVSQGQTIAAVGSTGWSTGPHLHFEIRQNGAKMNPLNYL